jgi:hypothetical protein
MVKRPDEDTDPHDQRSSSGHTGKLVWGRKTQLAWGFVSLLAERYIMKQVQCPNCQSYKTASNRLITLAVGMLFVFPMSLIFGAFLRVTGTVIAIIMGFGIILASYTVPFLSGYQCMNCQFKFKK